VPSLTPNIKNRVHKLPKPATATQALQPLFEAVSNAFYAIEDRFGSDQIKKGSVTIRIENLSDPEKIELEVRDNGIGMDEDRYNAFCEIDTDFKSAKGGKGIGRLFWLDAFQKIDVDSYFLTEGDVSHRAFSFALSNKDQITPHAQEHSSGKPEIGTTVSFKAIYPNEYAIHFPKRIDTFLRHFSAHFIADFLVGNSPQVLVDIDGSLTSYPKEISDLVVGDSLKAAAFETDDFGTLSVVGFTCKPEASTGLDGDHQLHLLANGRTVESRKIDNLLGLSGIDRNGEEGLFFHGCVSGEYLDARVNEGRTAFNLPERMIKDLCRTCADFSKQTLIPEQIRKYELSRRQSYDDFVNRHDLSP
tara:strand:- start:32 stop:1111 length:1080 start_codon:yes stop_codon:yes gene_type:complete